jgi:hypothetical protein
MTTSIEDQFGSRLMTAGGFLLNNELTDFSFVPEVDGAPVANRVQGGKRPRVLDVADDRLRSPGRVAIVTGSPGGSVIINYVAKSLVAIIDWNPRPAGRGCAPEFRQPQRSDRARSRYGGARTSRRSCARSAPTWRSCRSRAACTRSCGRATAGSAAPTRVAKARCAVNDDACHRERVAGMRLHLRRRASALRSAARRAVACATGTQRRVRRAVCRRRAARSEAVYVETINVEGRKPDARRPRALEVRFAEVLTAPRPSPLAGINPLSDTPCMSLPSTWNNIGDAHVPQSGCPR